MRLLIYYITHTFVNSIRKLFRTWVIFLILFFVAVGVICGITAAVVSSVMEDKTKTEQTQEVEEQPEEQKEQKEIVLAGMIPLNTKEEVTDFLEVLVFVFVVLIVAYNIYAGNKSGARIFNMADVNFLFASPQKPQSVLLFKTVLQMGLEIMGSLYLCFQLPNLVLNLGISLFTALSILAVWMFALMLGKLTSILTYTVIATHEHLRKYVKPLALVLPATLLGIVLIIMKTQGCNAYQAARTAFGGVISSDIPMIGWIKGVFIHAVSGDLYWSLVYGAFLVVGYGIMIGIIWNLKADFYEDAMTGAGINQEKLEMAKDKMQRGKKRSGKIEREGLERGEGANTLFWKQLYNRKRFAKLSVFTDTMLTYLGISVMFAIVLRKFMQGSSLFPLGIMLLVVVFFRSYGNPIAIETNAKYIYLIPQSAFSKIIWSVFAGTVDTILDIVPGIVIATLILRESPFQAIGWLLLILSADFIFSAIGLFIEMVMPTSLNEAIKGAFSMTLKMTAVFPMLITLVILRYFHADGVAFGIMTLVNVGSGILFLLVSSTLLHRGRA